MIRFKSLVMCLILGCGMSFAQNLSDLFKGNDFLTEVFVNPLGIEDLPNDTDAASIEEKIRQAGVEFKTMNLGPFGEVFRIIPKGMMIGETEIAGIAIALSNNYSMIIYQSSQTEKYDDMCKVLVEALNPYAKSIEMREYNHIKFSIFMLTDRLGIAVGANEATTTSIACLLDIENIRSFLGLGTLIDS